MANRIHFTTPKSKPFRKTNWTDSISLPWLFKWKTGELRLLRQSEKLRRHHAGREGPRHQVTICYQETTVHFSAVIDRDSVSPGIVRALRDGWRTINYVVFITDKRSALSLCPTQGRTNLVPVRIRCVSVLRTHPHTSGCRKRVAPEFSTFHFFHFSLYQDGTKCVVWFISIQKFLWSNLLGYAT